MKKHFSISYYFIFMLFIGCVEPERPKFQFKEGLVYIDAFASTIRGESYVNISTSGFKFNKFNNEFVPDANISFRNTETNTTVVLIEDGDIYLPPEDFSVSIGDSWELLVSLPNGQNYQSLIETVVPTVDFSDLKATYNSDLVFREDFNDFVPGHSISLDVNDPENERNFYHWRFRSFERTRICMRCENSIFRNGICDRDAGDNNGRPYSVSYWCDSDCWEIRFNESIELFSDESSNGKLINALPVAKIPYYTDSNIVVEIQQYTLSESAYNYFKILKDAVDNNSGINAPPPAALIGNLFNPNNDQEFVFGRFTAASTTTKRIFIDRSDITEDTIFPNPNSIQEEWCTLGCPPQECADFTCESVRKAPCSENRFRTSIMPQGWQE